MIVEQILQAKADKIKQWPVNANRASELGHECLRYLVLNRTRWQEKKMHDARVQMIFDIGNSIETLMQQDLREAGFAVVEQQRPFSWVKYQITGSIDLKLPLNEAMITAACQNGKLPDDVKAMLQLILQKARPPSSDPVAFVVPCEVKSAAPTVFDTINSIADMRKHKYPYMRRYPAQLTLYMIMDGKEVGLFLFKNKSTGEVKEIWMTLDYGFAETLVKKAELVNQHVAEGTLPDCIEYSEDLCGECAYAHICLPEHVGVEVEVSQNTELLELLWRYEKLKPGAKEYDDVNERINKMVQGKPKLLVGDFLIQGKWVDRASYNIPPEVKAQYKETAKTWNKQIIKV